MAPVSLNYTPLSKLNFLRYFDWAQFSSLGGGGRGEWGLWLYHIHSKSLTKIANLLIDNFYWIAKFVKKRYKDSRFRRDRVKAEEREMFNYNGVPGYFPAISSPNKAQISSTLWHLLQVQLLKRFLPLTTCYTCKRKAFSDSVPSFQLALPFVKWNANWKDEEERKN